MQQEIEYEGILRSQNGTRYVSIPKKHVDQLDLPIGSALKVKVSRLATPQDE